MKSTSSLSYIGHATVLIEMNGIRILTDPVLGKHVGLFIHRHVKPFAGTIADVDLVLLSHMHWDHYHLPSLRMVGRTVRIVAPAGTGAYLEQRGFTNVEEINVGEQVQIGDVTIEATPADHSGTRPPLGPAADCVGYVLSGAQTIYFAGDTDLFPEMAMLHEAIDVALLPVWGWGPTLGPGHMDPHRAAQALAYLQPRVAVPIHWGTYYPLGLRWLLPHHLSKPPTQFATHAQEFAPDVAVRIVQPGQDFEIPKAANTIIA